MKSYLNLLHGCEAMPFLRESHASANSQRRGTRGHVTRGHVTQGHVTRGHVSVFRFSLSSIPAVYVPLLQNKQTIKYDEL